MPTRLSASNTLLASPLPSWLTEPITTRFTQLGIFDGSPHAGVNHCLINEYPPGQGIMPHEDGGAYHPAVATVSLSGSLVLDVTTKVKDESEEEEERNGPMPSRESWRIFQEPRSLLVTAGSAYIDTLHGIADIAEDVDLSEQTVANWDLLGDKKAIIANGGRNERSTRISLTYRHVKKVSTVGSKLFGKARN